MAESSASYLQQLKALLPAGRLWDSLRESGKVFGELLHAFADEFERVDISNAQLVEEADPRTTLQLLPDWEEFASLPDPCLGEIERTLQDRRGALHTKLTNVGGQSIPYLIQQALTLGHEITVDETIVSVAGVLQAGDELSSNYTDRFYFQVNVPVITTYAFTAGASVSGDELGYWQPIRLECLLERIKPAHTSIIWNYL